MQQTQWRKRLNSSRTFACWQKEIYESENRKFADSPFLDLLNFLILRLVSSSTDSFGRVCLISLYRQVGFRWFGALRAFDCMKKWLRTTVLKSRKIWERLDKNKNTKTFDDQIRSLKVLVRNGYLSFVNKFWLSFFWSWLEPLWAQVAETMKARIF